MRRILNPNATFASAQKNIAARGFIEACGKGQKRRFSTARWSDDDAEGSRGNTETDVSYGERGTEGLVDMLELELRRSAHGALPHLWLCLSHHTSLRPSQASS